MALRAMADLADNTEDSYYAVLKKIWQMADKNPEDEKSPLPFIIGAVIILAVAGAVTFILLRRRDDFSEDEIDENGTIIDTENDMSWVDESIVVEDGFKNGEKVVGNFIPEKDFTFDFDEEDEEDNK